MGHREGHRYIVTDAERAVFERDGYVHLPGVLTEDELMEIDDGYDAFMRGEIDVTGRDLYDMVTGEFGRTVYCQGKMTREQYGRDHHPRCFVTWMAGGGVKSGLTIGETDDYSYNVTKDPVHVHDLNATVLRCLGIDHTRLTYKYQGRHFRLTDVHGNVVKQLLV